MSQGSKIFLLVLVVLLMIAALGLIIVLVVDGVDWSFLEFEETTEHVALALPEESASQENYDYGTVETKPDRVEYPPVSIDDLLNTDLDPIGEYILKDNEGSIVITEGSSAGIYSVVIDLNSGVIETVGLAFGERYIASLDPADSTLYLFAVESGTVNGYYINSEDSSRNAVRAYATESSNIIPPLNDIFFDNGLYNISGLNASGGSYEDSYYLNGAGVFFRISRNDDDNFAGVGMLLDDYLISVVDGYLNLYRKNNDYYEGIWIQYLGDTPGTETLTFTEKY